RGFDARANSDLRNAATSEEAAFATSQAYVPCTACTAANLPGFQPSATVTTSMAATAGANPSFTGTSTSTSGSLKTFSYDSTAGGMQ
ncbi:MAG: hypothetical protein ABI629_04625, partial [bacterium]